MTSVNNSKYKFKNYFRRNQGYLRSNLLFFFAACVLNGAFSCFGQDTTYHTDFGSVDLHKTLKIKVFDVIGKRREDIWLSGKVRRVDYEYSYIPTYNGSTQPANPKTFYKPIKVKSYYFVPIDDFIIQYRRSEQVFQTFSKDSSILRSYYEDGTPRDIYFLNDQLQMDSIYRFYENGKLKTKVLGASNQMTNNLMLSLHNTPEISLRSNPREWTPRNRRYVSDFRFRHSDYPDSKGLSYPEVQYYCHGNGNPQFKIDYIQDTANPKLITQDFTFYDLNGKLSDSTSISKDGAWTGVRYNYFESGIMESRSEVYRDRNYGRYNLWNREGELKYISYHTKGNRDSIVFYKQLKDTLIKWTPPTHFEWHYDGSVKSVKQGSFEIVFYHDGSLCQFGKERFAQITDQQSRNKKNESEYFGEKDELGLPHGRWYLIDKLKDTIYDINYKHGSLHGKYKVSSNYWPENWTRIYDMGLEIDSSYRTNKGIRNRTLFFSSPGMLAKEVEYFGDGRVHRIDTVLIGKKLHRLRTVHFDGWNIDIAVVDTAKRIVHRKSYFAQDSLQTEIWTDYTGLKKEWKEYHKETGELKTHWKYVGTEAIEVEGTKNEYDGRGNLITVGPKKRNVVLAIQLTYDKSGILTKTENLQDGLVIE